MGEQRRIKTLFEELLRLGPLSNQELSQTFDLSPASITHLVHPLLEKGMLSLQGAQSYPSNKSAPTEVRRRKKATFVANPNYGYFIIIELQKAKCIMRKVNFSIEIEPAFLEEFDTPDRHELVQIISAKIKAVIAVEQRPLLSIGFVVSGRMDPLSGGSYYQNPGDEQFNITLSKAIEHKLGISCVLQNDANALALFERFKGRAREVENFICLYIDEGVGLGIFANGSLYEGHRHLAGESGHYVLDPLGISIKDKPRGSFENYVSASGIQRELRNIGVEVEKSAAYSTIQAWLSGSPHSGIDKVYEGIIDRTALLTINLMHILAPEHIFIYGPLSNFGMGFSSPLIQKMISLTTSEREPYIQKAIITKPSANLGMVLGTAKTALDRFLLA